MNERSDEQPLELDGLYATAAPRPALEERAAADYRTAMAARSRYTRTHRRAAAAAAAILLFSAGYLTASLGRSSDTPADGRSYMLLLWQDTSFSAGSAPEQLAAEYAAWSRDVAASGVSITGSELADDRTIVPRPARPDASPAGGAFIGGYFIIGAGDTATARRLAEGHPHGSHGGWIEVVELVDR